MRTRTPRNSGVPGVLRVPETLKASNGAAYSEGNTNEKSQNTMPREHLWCSLAEHRKAEHFAPPLPDGRTVPRVARHTPAQASAGLACNTWGRGWLYG